MVARSSGHVRHFYNALCSSSEVFKYKCSAVGSHVNPVQFLDVTVSLVGDRVVAAPTLNKPITALCPTSGHAPFVHRSWPKSVAGRVHGTSSGCCHLAMLKLVANYRLANAHPAIIARLELFLEAPPSCEQKHEASHSIVFPCVLTYHPAFRRAAASSMRTFCSPVPAFRLLMSWANGLPSISSLVLKSSAKAGVNYLTKQNLGRGNHEEGILFLSSRQQTCDLTSLTVSGNTMYKSLGFLNLAQLH